jgi:hypothetical protein
LPYNVTTLFCSEDLMPFGVMFVVYHAAASGNPKRRGCKIRRSHYSPKTFLT